MFFEQNGLRLIFCCCCCCFTILFFLPLSYNTKSETEWVSERITERERDIQRKTAIEIDYLTIYCNITHTRTHIYILFARPIKRVHHVHSFNFYLKSSTIGWKFHEMDVKSHVSKSSEKKINIIKHDEHVFHFFSIVRYCLLLLRLLIHPFFKEFHLFICNITSCSSFLPFYFTFTSILKFAVQIAPLHINLLYH